MHPYWKLAYISDMVDGSENVLEEILDVSRRRNQSSGLSGMLMRDEQSYFQYLEGSRDALGTCMLRIAADPRHARVTVLLSARTDVLMLQGWSLGEARLPKRRTSLAGFARLLLSCDTEERISLVEKMCFEASMK